MKSTPLFKIKKFHYCQFCNAEITSNFPLCDVCLELNKNGLVILKDGKWQFDKDKIITKLFKNSYYNPSKNYSLKENLLTKYEKILYEILLRKLEPKYIAFPQINLQTIIQTDTFHRNDELYRNLDFCIFEKETLKPILAIELNDVSHETKEFKKKRDDSVKNILQKARLPLLTIKNDDLYKMTTVEIYNMIEKSLPQ